MKAKVLALAPALLACAAFAQFNDGKTYKPTTTTDPVTVITGTSLTATIPAYNASPTDITNLQNLYGSDLLTPGSNKADYCAGSPVPTNAYLKQECSAMNFARGNKNTRMHFYIDPVTDPALVNGNNASKFPATYTGGTPNVSGAYTACTTSLSSTPAVKNKERCEIGNEVTEGSCYVPLTVTVEWAVYNNQSNANLDLGYCPAGQFRGDKSPYPAQNSYYTVNKTCSSLLLGTGDATITYKSQCWGDQTLVGYDWSKCSVPYTPSSLIATQTVAACHSAPPTIDNCFDTNGQFTTKTTVPLISESRDYSSCGTFYQYQTTIK